MTELICTAVCICICMCVLYMMLLDFYFGSFFICYVISITHAQLTHVIIQSCGQPLNKIDDLFKAMATQKKERAESRDPLTPRKDARVPLKFSTPCEK